MCKNGQPLQVWRSTKIQIKKNHIDYSERPPQGKVKTWRIFNFLLSKVCLGFLRVEKRWKKKERTRKTTHPSNSSQITSMSPRITHRDRCEQHTLTVHSHNEILGLGIFLITVLVWINKPMSLLFGVLVCGREVGTKWPLKPLPK